LVQSEFCCRCPFCHNGMTATCLAAASRSRAEAGLPGRHSAALEGDAAAKHPRQVVRQQAAAGALHRADNSFTRHDRQIADHSVDITPVGPSPFFDCGSETAEPHIRSPLRRSSRLAPKSLMLEVVGLGRANQSLSRHLAARTLCGPPAEIGQGSASLADGRVLRDVASCGHAALNTAPSGTSPCVTQRQSAISNLRASATMAIRRIRPRSVPTRVRNQRLSALSG
jgi:hypothetical protein